MQTADEKCIWGIQLPRWMTLTEEKRRFEVGGVPAVESADESYIWAFSYHIGTNR